jgi:hypothetical protein
LPHPIEPDRTLCRFSELNVRYQIVLELIAIGHSCHQPRDIIRTTRPQQGAFDVTLGHSRRIGTPRGIIFSYKLGLRYHRCLLLIRF